jgi:hypothetical protein
MNGTRKYCSSECYWENLKKIHAPFATPATYKVVRENGKRIREHVWVVEKHLGRKLSKGEVVHHKNGNKHDNRIENLEVMSQSEHIKKHFTKVHFGKV